MNDYELPNIPLFKLLSAARVSTLLSSHNSILREAPHLVQWGKDHQLISKKMNKKHTRKEPSTKKRHMRRIESHEHEHIQQATSQPVAG